MSEYIHHSTRICNPCNHNRLKEKTCTKLLKCGRCLLVLYCGTDHQKGDWKNHRTFCKAIQQYMNLNSISHIYDNVITRMSLKARVLDLQRYLLSTGLKRDLQRHEIAVTNRFLCSLYFLSLVWITISDDPSHSNM